MTLKVQVFTMNCGNSTPGVDAATELVKQLQDSLDTDLFILNCQEVDFNSVMADLKKATEQNDLIVTSGHQMVTHTKFSTQFHYDTGMMSIVLHKPEIRISYDDSVNGVARRESTRGGSGYNKGGMLTRISAVKDQQEYKIDTLNGHLDAFSDAARSQDWANIHRLQRFQVGDWQHLSRIIPHLSCSGLDMNTRNKFSQGTEGKVETECAWDNPSEPDMQALAMASLGNYHQSEASTYLNTNETDSVLNVADKRRLGRAKGGMLDLVSFNDAAAARRRLENAKLPLVAHAGFSMPPREGAERDHTIIGSHIIVIDAGLSEYVRVRDAIACALVDVAPELAGHLFSNNLAEDTPENRTYLLNVYQLYLSPEGLLQKHLQLHAKKLQYLTEFQQKTSAENSPELLTEFKQQLFSDTPWLRIDTPHLINSYNGLLQAAATHNALFDLDEIKYNFLHLAASETERKDVQAILASSLQKLSVEPEPVELNKWVKQTEQLLAVNHVLHRYERFLPVAPVGESDELLESKRKIISELKETLAAERKPIEIVEQLQQDLIDKEPKLSEHRDDRWYHQLWRNLQAIINKDALLTKGALFAREAKALFKSTANPGDQEPTNNIVNR